MAAACRQSGAAAEGAAAKIQPFVHARWMVVQIPWHLRVCYDEREKQHKQVRSLGNEAAPRNLPHLWPPFKSVKDYPQVLVLGFEQLPVPEAVDNMSDAAAQRQTRRRIKRGADGGGRPEAGINMTPVVDQACATAEVQGYLSQLNSLIGQAVTPSKLFPTFPADGHFRWAYPVGDAAIYLSLGEAEPAGLGERTARVEVHCEGPNLGSAGGPTLQELGAIARVRYRGLLVSHST